MRTVLGWRAVLAPGVLAVLAAAGPDRDLEARLKAKLAQQFVRNADWVLDYDKALERSRRSRRLVFAYFTRSFEP
jgi:hypothetical protein